MKSAMMNMTLKDKDFQRTSPFEKTFKQKRRLKDPRFGSISIIQNPKTRELLAVREVKEGKKDLAGKKIINCRKRMANKHPNLLNLKDYSVTKQSELCSSYYIIKEFYEYPKSDLRREIRERTKKGETLNDKELTHILYQQIQANSYLQAKGQSHGNIQPLQIGYNKNDMTSKLIDTSGNEATNLKMQRQLLRNKLKSKNNLYMSPTTFENLSKGNMNYKTDQSKEDTFALGLTILESGNGDSVQDCYNKKNGSFDKVALQKHINNFNNKFGHENTLLASTVSSMANPNEEERPDPRSLETSMPDYEQVKLFLDNKENNVNSQQPMVDHNDYSNQQNMQNMNDNNNYNTHTNTENDAMMQNNMNNNNDGYNFGFDPYEPPVEVEAPVQEVNPYMVNNTNEQQFGLIDLPNQQRKLQSGVPMNLPMENNVEQHNVENMNFQKQNHMVQNSQQMVQNSNSEPPFKLLDLPVMNKVSQNESQTNYLNHQNEQSYYTNQSQQQEYVHHQPQQVYQNERVVQHQPQQVYQSDRVIHNQPQQVYQSERFVQNEPEKVYQSHNTNSTLNTTYNTVNTTHTQPQVIKMEPVYRTEYISRVDMEAEKRRLTAKYNNTPITMETPVETRVVTNNHTEVLRTNQTPVTQTYTTTTNQPTYEVRTNQTPVKVEKYVNQTYTTTTNQPTYEVRTSQQHVNTQPTYEVRKSETRYVNTQPTYEVRNPETRYVNTQPTYEVRTSQQPLYTTSQTEIRTSKNQTPLYTTGNNNYTTTTTTNTNQFDGLKLLRTYEDNSHARN